jgi:hypothetical protein
MTNLQMSVSVPEAWTVWESADTGGSGIPETEGKLFAGLEQLVEMAGPPDFVATLFAPMGTEDGDLLAVVTASVAVRCLPLSELPALEAWPTSGVVQTVKITDEISADFFKLAVPIYEPAAGVGAIALFVTPNLPLVADMEPGFRSIAASITFLGEVA